jgi:glycosyltransferase 2 family protein
VAALMGNHRALAPIRMVARGGWLATVAGVAVMATVAFRLGTGPFVAGLRAVTGWSVAAAVAITVMTTVCSAWRWTVVARRLGAEIPLKHAVTMYYRAQFLNTTLPGGVLGDVHRGVRQGRDAGDVGRGVRAVAVERIAGQVVQIVIAAVVLVAVASPLRSELTIVLAAVTTGLLVTALAAISFRRRERRPGAVVAWSQVAVSSVVVVCGYTAMFVIAARVAGSRASTEALLPLAVLALLAMAVPTNVGGWGPREGVAAWAFGVAGLGSATGLTTATVYGVMTIAACAPGGVVLALGWLRPRQPIRRRRPASQLSRSWAVVAESKGGARG